MYIEYTTFLHKHLLTVSGPPKMATAAVTRAMISNSLFQMDRMIVVARAWGPSRKESDWSIA